MARSWPPECATDRLILEVSSLLAGLLVPFRAGIHLPLEDGRRLEHDYATRRDGRSLTSLGIAAHALAFLAHDKQAERRQLYRFATLQAVCDFLEHELNEFGGFDSRQADLLTDRLT